MEEYRQVAQQPSSSSSSNARCVYVCVRRGGGWRVGTVPTPWTDRPTHLWPHARARLHARIHAPTGACRTTAGRRACPRPFIVRWRLVVDGGGVGRHTVLVVRGQRVDDANGSGRRGCARVRRGCVRRTSVTAATSEIPSSTVILLDDLDLRFSYLREGVEGCAHPWEVCVCR